MSVQSNGTPALASTAGSNTASVTGTFPTGSAPAAGDLIVCVVTMYGSTSATSVTQSGGSGTYANPVSIIGTSCLTSIWTKTATGSDTAPVFTGAATGTTGDADITITVYDLSDPATGNTPVLDVSGTATGTTSIPAATTSGNVSLAGELAICSATVGQGTTTNTNSWTTPTNWTLAQAGNAQTATARSQTANYYTTNSTVLTAGSTATVTMTDTRTTTHTAALIAVFKPVYTSGPPLSTMAQAGGLRVTVIRTGLVMTSLVQSPQAGPPITSGPPIPPRAQPWQAARPLPPRGLVRGIAGVALVAATLGPPLTPPHGPVSPGITRAAAGQQVRLPLRGRVYGVRSGTYGGHGPAVKPLAGPVKARPPLPSRGRVASNPGAPVPNVIAVCGAIPAAVRAATYEPLRGRITASPVKAPTAPVVTPATLYPLHGPVTSRVRVLPPRGTAQGRAGTFQGTGPSAIPLHGPVTSRVRVSPPRGVTVSRAGTVQGTGPAVAPLKAPVRSPVPQRTRGGQAISRAGVRDGLGPAIPPRAEPWRSVIPARTRGGTATGLAGIRDGSGPQVTPLRQPVRAPVPARTRGGVAVGRAGTYAGEGPQVTLIHGPVRASWPARARGGTVISRAGIRDGQGPAPKTLTSPVRAAWPAQHRGGWTAARRGVYTSVAPVQAPLYPLHEPVRAPLQPALPGRGLAMGALPAPVTLPPLTPLSGPVKAAIRVLPLRGTTASRAGIRDGSGPAVRPLTSPVQARRPLPGPGRAYGIVRAVAPVPAPTSGPPLRPHGGPWQARLSVPSVHGFALAMGSLPAPPTTPAVIAPRATPFAAVSRGLPLRGRVYGVVKAVAPAPPPTSGPPLHPRTSPAQARLSAYRPHGFALAMGTVPVPVPNPGPPIPPRATPWRAVIPQAVRGGQVRSSAGTRQGTGPQLGALPQPFGVRVVYARTGHVQSAPVKAAPPLPPVSGPPIAPRATPWRAPIPQRTRGGQVRSSTGTRSGHGPAVRPLTQPVRAAWPARVHGGTAQGRTGTYTYVPPVPAPPYPLREPVRAPIPLQHRGGTVISRAGIRDSTGPALTPLRGPVRAAWPARTRGGTAAWRSGTYTFVSPVSGPKIQPRNQPVRAALPASFRHGTCLSSQVPARPYVAIRFSVPAGRQAWTVPAGRQAWTVPAGRQGWSTPAGRNST